MALVRRASLRRAHFFAGASTLIRRRSRPTIRQGQPPRRIRRDQNGQWQGSRLQRQNTALTEGAKAMARTHLLTTEAQ